MKFLKLLKGCFKNIVFILLMKLHEITQYAINLYDLPIFVSFSTH
jgi:hypothetical protein